MLRYDPDEVVSPSLPSIQHHETGYYMRREADETLFVGHYPGSYHEAGTTYNPDSVTGVPADIRRGAREFLERFIPDAQNAELTESAVGIRSLTPDAEPIIGETAIDGLSVVAFNANGIQLSPIAGRVITALLSNDSTPFDQVADPKRF